ncbi:inorganic pyrophosphatase/K(+)-stimulated pyrophosphate-energized sodium pump [Rhodopirellula rubra]|uniref:Putative K(+)-stimulated pyrophosphate-energized sodium pump n=1 Tax=Aporhodopirellula rubra TaxID=980271 RepID=A0A7W5E1U9_9BACT|nr:sodium-translocating pyrophosphatase [Aporhodopirellula rubra]MBB3208638.1 inorganic pyrophosphatase/K(+)-stimulated pyrophosphate-energized sodium pump [Aporhodopirellula rubra]
MDAILVWLVATGASVLALTWARRFHLQMMKADEGTDEMRAIAESVRTGAAAYLHQQNKVVAIVFLVVTALLAVAAVGLKVLSVFTPIAFLTGGLFSGLCGWIGMRTATQASSRTAAGARVSLNDGLQVAFRSGAVMGLTVVGMGLLYLCIWFAVLYWLVPMVGGADAELSLHQISVTMLTFGMGASAQALFARVGGGIFTKAADVGADLVGKVEQSLAEDSPRNPATIADNVGDNVGDVAGMGADLYESYTGSVLAAAALGVAAMSQDGMLPEGGDVASAQLHAMLLPLAIAAMGILCSIAGIYAVKTGDSLSQKALLHALARGINRSSLFVVVGAIALSIWLMPKVPGTLFFGLVPGIAISVIVGLMAGWAIGWWTERVTSDEYATTQHLAGEAETGSATIIIGGVADGMLSVWFPVLVVSAAMFLAFGFANGGEFNDLNRFSLGLYGVGLAAVGMLSTLGITLATDAYGPIADNAGGNAEMAGLEPVVRERTDALDSLGNTTAATGKGFAIGSAALTALALLAAYVEGVRDGFDRWGMDVASEVSGEGHFKLNNNLMIEKTPEGTQTFLIMPTRSETPQQRATWHAIAGGEGIDENVVITAIEGDRVEVTKATLQDFLHYYDTTLMNPRVLVGIFLGAMSTFLFCAMTMKSVGRAAQGMVVEVRRQFVDNPGILEGTVTPDYQRPIEISTKAAQREMILPSLLGLLLPIVVGLLLGVGGVLGLLTGCLTSGFCLAVFMANSGGMWDNAKKYIEAGHHGGKGSLAHKAAVVGDTVGDPFKDTSGPSLNILIKLMSMVSVVVAGLIVRYSLVALEIF